jgi:glyoxylase-like metal-dependent hydrolase (beta-lactamase superfamily II)
VILLPAGNASAWTGPTGNNTYLLPGQAPTLIDAGVGSREHLDALARALDAALLARVLLTHGHVDHVAGVPALRARWPGVDVRQFGAGERPLRDGERIDAGDVECIVLHTPGHAADHCCFVCGGDVFCGDLARIGGTIVIPASRGGDLAAYLDSLRKIRELRPARLLPAHGPIIDNPADVIDQYLAHRERRDEQSLDALAAGASTPGDIVNRVYGALPDQLRGAAVETVLAHLIKLRNEGRVEQHDDSWSRSR